MSDMEMEQSVRPERPGRKKKVILAVAIIAALIGVSVLGYSAYQDHRHDQAVAQHKAEVKAAKKVAAKKAAAERKTCENEIGDFLETLKDIDARLNVGITQETLGDLTGDASSERSDVDEDNLPAWCADALDYADEAFSEYADTTMEWNDCIWDDYCDPDLDLDLQSPWVRAGEKIDMAEKIFKEGSSGEST